MPFALGCLSLVFPRLALFLLWLLRDGYLTAAFGTWTWPVAGFFLMPLTTLAFAYASNSLGAPGEVTPLGWLLIALAVLSDIGVIGRQASKRRRD